jgi:hypothetical protein
MNAKTVDNNGPVMNRPPYRSLSMKIRTGTTYTSWPLQQQRNRRRWKRIEKGRDFTCSGQSIRGTPAHVGGLTEKRRPAFSTVFLKTHHSKLKEYTVRVSRTALWKKLMRADYTFLVLIRTTHKKDCRMQEDM